MRYWLISAAVILLAAAADSQETKGKDTGKETGKPEVKFPTEIAGKSFDQWRAEAKSNDPARREVAYKTICLFGPKAYEVVPDIIADLSRHPIKAKIDLSVRVNGMMALSTIFRYTEKPDQKLIDAALPLYKAGMTDSQVIMKMRAVQGIIFLGPSARTALGDVIVLARDGATWELRKEAVQVIIMMAPDGKGKVDNKFVLPALKKAAADDVTYPVRVIAMQGLGLLGNESNMIDFTKAIKEDPSKEVKLAAITSMANAGKKKALVPLRKLLDESPDKEIRLQVLNAFSALKDEIDWKFKGEPNLKAIIEVSKFDKEPIVRIWANATLINGTGDFNHLDPVLKLLATHKEATVRHATLQVIALGGERSKSRALKPVEAAVGDPEIAVAVAAVETLVHMRAFESTPMLRDITKDMKARDELKDAADVALQNFDLIKANEKKEKEKKDKK
jgi:HEAT repeat protein